MHYMQIEILFRKIDTDASNELTYSKEDNVRQFEYESVLSMHLILNISFVYYL